MSQTFQHTKFDFFKTLHFTKSSLYPPLMTTLIAVECKRAMIGKWFYGQKLSHLQWSPTWHELIHVIYVVDKRRKLINQYFHNKLDHEANMLVLLQGTVMHDILYLLVTFGWKMTLFQNMKGIPSVLYLPESHRRHLTTLMEQSLAVAHFIHQREALLYSCW